ncbi:MAG: DUF6100 family protein [Oscillospiraceae bacterium]|nr:DUF6100 family protein [Oscillospiraceae bacterium]
MKITEQASPFKKEVLYAEKQLKKMQESMEAIKQNLEAGDIEGAYKKSFDFAAAAEKLTLISRQLPAYTGNPQAQKMSEKIITDNIPVRIGFTYEGWFGVIIPALLPKKQKGSVDYIREYLYLAMGEFFRGKPPVRYTDSVIIFRHIYQHNRPERHYRDHDNIEVNIVTDIIAHYVLFDDSPRHCSNYYCSAPGYENRTEVFVVPKSEFITWIADADTHKNKGVTLYENLP